MRKAITIMIVLALGVSLWADNAQTKPVKGARVSSDRFPLHTSTNDNDRTESYTLVMVDSYGDGWNGGAAVDVLVNGTMVLDSATVPTGYEGATENFDVEVGDTVTTVWTAGTWDSECAYAIYNPSWCSGCSGRNRSSPRAGGGLHSFPDTYWSMVLRIC